MSLDFGAFTADFPLENTNTRLARALRPGI
jgi:hypothetical protein